MEFTRKELVDLLKSSPDYAVAHMHIQRSLDNLNRERPREESDPEFIYAQVLHLLVAYDIFGPEQISRAMGGVSVQQALVAIAITILALIEDSESSKRYRDAADLAAKEIDRIRRGVS